jgi:hypothetical protein
MPETKKRCAKCKDLKEVVSFSRHKKTKDGRGSYCGDCRVIQAQAWRAKNRGRHNLLLRVARLRRSGVRVTPDTVLAMEEEQGGKCAICGREESLIRCNQLATLSLDHCHKTNVVRGLLCRRCNTGIANFDEDVDRMRAAIAYLAATKPCS